MAPSKSQHRYDPINAADRNQQRTKAPLTNRDCRDAERPVPLVVEVDEDDAVDRQATSVRQYDPGLGRRRVERSRCFWPGGYHRVHDHRTLVCVQRCFVY